VAVMVKGDRLGCAGGVASESAAYPNSLLARQPEGWKGGPATTTQTQTQISASPRCLEGSDLVQEGAVSAPRAGAGPSALRPVETPVAGAHDSDL